ncbi:MAG: sugar isomerase domain-containing protein [Candidatus Limnocylindrales bacterium]
MSLDVTGTPGWPYLDALGNVLGRAKVANVESVPAAARIVAGVVAGNGIVYAFGSGHSQLVALEVNRRAGSIAPVQVVFDPMWGLYELVEGYGRTLLSEVAFTGADCLVVISNSGTTVAPIEVAMAARAAGTPVIALTTVGASPATRSNPGKRLCELGDVVLDNGGIGPDEALRVGSVGVGATSTLVAAALLYEVIVEAVVALAARGIEAPVYRANAEEGGREHNARLRERYHGRLKTVP